MISKQTRQAVRAAYVFTCGYCGIGESETGAELTIDHFMPRVAGGDDNFDNLVYACHACNEFKGQAWNEQMPRTLHPAHDSLEQHLREDADGRLVPLTDAGQRHIETPHLNRPPLVRHRRLLKVPQNALLTEEATQARLAALEKAVRDLIRQNKRR